MMAGLKLKSLCQILMKRLIISFFWILFLSGSIQAENKCPSIKVHAWDNCVGNYQLSDGSSYTGFFKSGRFDGQGVLNYSNGNKYEGQFKSGKRNGLGLFSYYHLYYFLYFIVLLFLIILNKF